MTENYHQINGGTKVQLSELHYTPKDQISEKNIGKVGAGFLQSLDYTYLPNGFLSAINDASLGGGALAMPTCSDTLPNPTSSTTLDNNDLFHLALKYDNTDGSSVGAQDQKNGNIGQIIWRTRGRERQTYGFQYDFLDRLTSATFDEISESGSLRGKNWYSTNYQYDPRGNIDYLNRKGAYWDGACWQVGTIDSLHMTLKWTNSNRYRRIRDLAPAASKDYGFRQTSSNLSSYQYDANGNLILDLNKNMDVVYNYLNLPERIEFDDCMVIEFTYDANGTKLRKELKNGAMLLATHDYLGSIEYKGSELEAIYHEEGRVYYEGGTGRYEYNIQDHLGNTRLTFTDRDDDGKIEITDDPETTEVLQENHYYPFGMAMDGQWMANPGRDDKYQYNGKELHDDFGLRWYAYGARFYDPAVGRFTGVDPIADRFPWVSTYNYAENEPIANIDLWGLQKLSFQELVNRALEFFGLDGKTLKEGPRDQKHANSISTVRKNAENLKKGTETLIDIQTAFVPGGSLMNPNADGGDVVMDFAGIIFPGLKIIDKSNTAFKIAAEGGNHSGFLKNYLGKTAEQLQKGIDSFNKQIQKHLDKIDNPSKEIADFDKLDIRQQQNLVEKKWPSDIKRLKEQKDILQGLLDNVNLKE